ncbi:MAG: hypothetical protein LBG27_06640 [Spirochaetaceae bacterium]|nr:hypothetical protein [Spirochaetaceae bacterium]
MTKYKTAPIAERTYGGEVFASKSEMERCIEFLALERRGEISERSIKKKPL